MSYIPQYIKLYETGELNRRADSIREKLYNCSLCPQKCMVNRMAGEKGFCGTCELPIVSSYGAHRGEERCISGSRGSGTIFFAGCNMGCIFCQNYDISHLKNGRITSIKDLAGIMLVLQKQGCHNINFVTPSHVVSSIVDALILAIPEGLKIPLVYNSGGYDSVETLNVLDGIIDIYMPDFKYMDEVAGLKFSCSRNYPLIASSAVTEMHRQRGDLVLDSRGIAESGLLVRHLVLPNNAASTDRVISFIAGLSRNTYINIMDQYRPVYRAMECFDLRRRVTLDEYDRAVEYAKSSGLHRFA